MQIHWVNKIHSKHCSTSTSKQYREKSGSSSDVVTNVMMSHLLMIMIWIQQSRKVEKVEKPAALREEVKVKQCRRSCINMKEKMLACLFSIIINYEKLISKCYSL